MGPSSFHERDPAISERADGEPLRLRILLVDDDVLVRCGTADMLSYAGHLVNEAGSGPAALDILAQDAAVDLLITDNRMPGMSGAALIERVRNDRPTLPILMITGYASRGDNIGADIGLLTKPFREAGLLSAVQELVRERNIAR